MSEPKLEFPGDFKFKGPQKETTYQGGCHCGSVKYTMTMPSAIEDCPVCDCNCSICQINGYYMIYPNRTDFKLEGEDAFERMTGYLFAEKKITHYFCKTCGTSIGAKPGEDMKKWFGDLWAVNARTVNGLDFSKLDLRKIDGKKF